MNTVRLFRFFTAFALLVPLSQCRNASDKIKVQELQADISPEKIELGDTATVFITEDIPATSVTTNYAEEIVSRQGNRIDFVFQSVGEKQVTLSALSGDRDLRARLRVEVVAAAKPQARQFEIVQIVSHDKNAYTQGLEIHNGYLYESIGQYGKSAVRKFDLNTLQMTGEVKLDPRFFGEGLTVVNGTVYQLTWQEGTCFLYDSDLHKTGEKKIPLSEGWGICHSADYIYLSDGSSNLYKTNRNLVIQEKQPVYSGELPLSRLNELEWVEGKIFANVYQSDVVYIIDPHTGVAEGYADMSRLRPMLDNPLAEVLNGIAYSPGKNQFLVTGKHWDKAFWITLSE